MARPIILDVLADRYASTAILDIWSAEAKIIAERRLWIAVLKAQLGLGVPNITEEAICAYEACIDQVNLASIRERELVTKHDVKARIEVFNELAGYELVHTGMTSRDLTENVEQWQIRQSLDVVYAKITAVLSRLGRKAIEYQDLCLTGRSHNVAAQMTTLGKRFASSAEELFFAMISSFQSREYYLLRGIKGPVGTQQDMLDLLESEENVQTLEDLVAEQLGFDNVSHSVGQVYPRSLDFQVLADLVQIAAIGSSFATTLRLMAGQELVTEGFKEGQVGSSAMPHKMNARSSERMCGFYNVLRGYLAMVEGIAGNQWNEGDVSCSVVRRVALPGAFFAIDGLLETWLTVLDGFGAYPAVIDREVRRYLPFLAVTKILMAAVKVGMGREQAHKIIKKHAVAAGLAMREQGVDDNPLVRSLGEDPDFPLSESEIQALIGDPAEFTGLARSQVKHITDLISDACAEGAAYNPEPIL